MGLTLAWLPRRIGYLAAWLAGTLVYILSPGIRAAVADNIKHVLEPGTSEDTLKKTVRIVLINAAKNYFDLIHTPHMTLDDVEHNVTKHGWHHIEDMLKEGKGVMLFTAHLGSFDMTMHVLPAISAGITILVEPLEPPLLLRHVTRLREGKGVSILPVYPGVSKAAVKALRQRKVVLVACDRDVQNDGVAVKFFGEETTLPVRVIQLAMRAGAAIIPIFNIRRPDGRYDVFIEQPIEISPVKKKASVGDMERVVSIMEKNIRRYPEQWVVLSRVWGNRR
ncbi:lysophospholipid acyltransferase family protein [Chloroflexota bacterium]